MFYKKISKALLSFVLDKKARNKLQAPFTGNFEVVSKIEDKRSLNKNFNESSNLSENYNRNLLQLSNSPKKIDQARLALINQAMSIYRSKRYIIEQLPEKQREKLMFMALKIFGDQKDNSKPE